MTSDDVIVTASNRIGRKVPHLIVRGLDERDILAMAPAMTCDRVHWDTIDAFDARDLLPDLEMGAYTRQWSDGQHRVWVPVGEGHQARELIRQWCSEHEVEAVNIRVETEVPFRDLDSVPDSWIPDLIAAAVDWLYPRTHAVRAKLVADLELIDAEDVRSMMYLFVSDHLDRYDANRLGRNGTLNLLAFLLGKIRTWPQDLSRTMLGRNVVNDRVVLHRTGERTMAEEHRFATEVERAEALKTSVTDLRKREHAIATLSGMRNYVSLTGDPDDHHGEPVALASDDDVDSSSIDYARSAELTRAILSAVNDPTSMGRRAQDPLALAAVYLTFWEELSRPELARELDVLPKTAHAALTRVLERVEQSDLQ